MVQTTNEKGATHMVVRRVGAMSYAKLNGMLGALIGLLIGAIISLFSLIGAGMGPKGRLGRARRTPPAVSITSIGEGSLEDMSGSVYRPLAGAWGRFFQAPSS